MTLRSTPTFVQGGSHPAENVRLMVQSLLAGATGAFAGGVGAFDAGHGVGRAGDLLVEENGTPNMSVEVAAGGGFVRNTDSADGGVYHVYNDAPVNLVIAAADPSDPRWDLVIARVRDSEYSGSDDDALLEVVAGTPDASPADPVVPDNSLVLARVVVAAGVSSITDAAITNLAGVARPWNTAWGRVFSTTSLSSFTFTNTMGNSSTFTWASLAGRRYEVAVAAEFQSAGSTPHVATLSVRTSANADVNSNVLRWTSRDAGDQFRAGASFVNTPGTTGNITWKLSAVSSASTSTQTITSIAVIIKDVGPA
jgi:hypothetical protein